MMYRSLILLLLATPPVSSQKPGPVEVVFSPVGYGENKTKDLITRIGSVASTTLRTNASWLTSNYKLEIELIRRTKDAKRTMLKYRFGKTSTFGGKSDTVESEYCSKSDERALSKRLLKFTDELIATVNPLITHQLSASHRGNFYSKIIRKVIPADPDGSGSLFYVHQRAAGSVICLLQLHPDFGKNQPKFKISYRPDGKGPEHKLSLDANFAPFKKRDADSVDPRNSIPLKYRHKSAIFTDFGELQTTEGKTVAPDGIPQGELSGEVSYMGRGLKKGIEEPDKPAK
jgi:hypothetical protein